MFVQRDLRRVVIIFACIVLVSMGLNVISHSFYPVPYFFLPQNLSEERAFLQEIDAKRAGLMAENLFIYSVAAPQPYESIRRGMPRFNFLYSTIREYAWFGWPALILWIGMLGLTFFSFFRGLRTDWRHKYLTL